MNSFITASGYRGVARYAFALFTALAIASGFFIPVAYATITTITLDSPDGAEEWRGTQTIDWSGVSDNVTDKIDITFAPDGTNFNEVIVSNVLFSTGLYSWNTLLPDPDTLTARIRISPSAFPVIDSSTNTTFTVDNTAPITTLTIDPIDGANGWYMTVPTIDLSCADGGSGCDETYYRWDNVGPYLLVSIDGQPVAMEGEHILSYYSEDEAVDALGAHNVEDETSIAIKVDTTDPTVDVTSITLDGAYNVPDEINVTLTFSEAITTTDTITVTLETGTTDRTCIVPVMTNASVGACTYTVQAGDTSADLNVNTIAATTSSILDVAGNTADVSLASSNDLNDNSNIVIDTTAPTAFAVGTVVTTDGTVVAGWWNGTNTGVDVDVPVAADDSLTGGTTQLQAEADGVFENIGDPYTILVGDLGTDVTISLTFAQLEAIAGFGDGDNVQFTAVIPDIAENATTGTESGDNLNVVGPTHFHTAQQT